VRWLARPRSFAYSTSCRFSAGIGYLHFMDAEESSDRASVAALLLYAGGRLDSNMDGSPI
jgi:hypothetical protein